MIAYTIEGAAAFGHAGRPLRDLGDALTGVETSEALHALIGGGS